MKLGLLIVTLLAHLSILATACLILEGTYMTVNNQLIVKLVDNGNTLCDTNIFTTNQVSWLNCAGGHQAWIRRPDVAEWPERTGWEAGFIRNDGQRFDFGVDSEIIYSSGGNRDVGRALHAANYGC